MYRGNDAVFLATQKKDGILTAEQIKLLFDSVGGRLINEAVREGQVVMELRPDRHELGDLKTSGANRSARRANQFHFGQHEHESFQSHERQATILPTNRQPTREQSDDATMTLNVARANVYTQQQLLDRLLAGVADTGVTDSPACRRFSRSGLRQKISVTTSPRSLSRKNFWKSNSRNSKSPRTD